MVCAANCGTFCPQLICQLIRSAILAITTKGATTINTAVFTTYFVNNPDPQRKEHAPADDYSYVAPWHQSMTQLGLNGVIFHDGLSAEFMSEHGGNGIQFEFVSPDEFEYSLNDYRFVIYERYLRNHPEIEAVFMTDGNDVAVVQEPFSMIDPKRVYVGSEMEFIEDSQWVKRRFYFLNQGPAQFPMPKSLFRRKHRVYNAGILGGSREICMEFLGHMVGGLAQLTDEQKMLNVNMALFNHTVYAHFKRRAVTGQPLHSEYKDFQADRKDVYFIHK